VRIGTVDTDARVLIVAEVGNNHEGDPARARELVRRAADCGVDAVKVQTFRTEHFVSRRDEPRFARLKSFELSIEEFAGIAAEARECGVLFIATPLDIHSAAALEPLVDAYKIASGDITFVPLLMAVAATGKPVLLSSGASTSDEVAHAADVLRRGWTARGVDPSLAVLHCVSSYPAPAEEANLRAIARLGELCGATAGYSDHVLGNEAAVAAVAAGARIVEKHFTLDKQFSDFRDHRLSADPDDMRDLVARVRATERMLGSGHKRVQPSEADMRGAIRRSVVMARDCSGGHTLTGDDITWLRPGGGLAPGLEPALMGKRLRRDVRAGDPLGAGDVE
jgi:N,N'-diacetyllegionaminate synthase